MKFWNFLHWLLTGFRSVLCLFLSVWFLIVLSLKDWPSVPIWVKLWCNSGSSNTVSVFFVCIPVFDKQVAKCTDNDTNFYTRSTEFCLLFCLRNITLRATIERYLKCFTDLFLLIHDVLWLLLCFDTICWVFITIYWRF